MTKVFCNDCKYLSCDFLFLDVYQCKSNPGTEFDPISGANKIFADPISKNKNFDCKEFKSISEFKPRVPRPIKQPTRMVDANKSVPLKTSLFQKIRNFFSFEPFRSGDQAL